MFTGHKVSTVAELLRSRAIFDPERTAYRFLGGESLRETSVTYKEIDRRACALAAWLGAEGLAGERIALLYPTGLDFVAAFFGVLYAGGTVVPLNPPRVAKALPRLEAIFADAGVKATLTDSTIFSKLSSGALSVEWIGGQRFIQTDANTWSTARSTDLVPAGPEALAVIQYTSGSTAVPRGVKVTNENILHNAAMIAQAGRLNSDSVGVNWLPLFHDMGLMSGVIEPLFACYPITLMSPAAILARPIAWLRAISEYRATVSGAPNFAYDLCVEKIAADRSAELDLSSWRLAFCGSEPIRADTLDRFVAHFAACGFRRSSFLPCYGLAEATVMVSGGPTDTDPTIVEVDRAALESDAVAMPPVTGASGCTLVASGRPHPEQQLLIVDPRTCIARAENEVGEIWVKGPSVAAGYWNREADAAFCGSLSPSSDGPFLRTGDLGFLREGTLFVVGRLKDVIVVRGSNHYAEDIELTVAKSHPALRAGQGTAFSVQEEGPEQVVIVQELKRTWLRDATDILSAIRGHVGEQHGIAVDAVVLVRQGSIPKTSSGKVQRYETRAAFVAGTLEAIAEWRRPPDLRVAIHRQDADEPVMPPKGDLTPVGQNSLSEHIGAVIAMELARILKVPRENIATDQPIRSFGLNEQQLLDLRAAIAARAGAGLEFSDLFGHRKIAELECLVGTGVDECWTGASPVRDGIVRGQARNRSLLHFRRRSFNGGLEAAGKKQIGE